MDFKQEFIRLFDTYVKRDGAKELVEWLTTTDFFTAPASTRYHSAFEGGLVLHSLNVFTQLNQLAELYGLGPDDGFRKSG